MEGGAGGGGGGDGRRWRWRLRWTGGRRGTLALALAQTQRALSLRHNALFLSRALAQSLPKMSWHERTTLLLKKGWSQQRAGSIAEHRSSQLQLLAESWKKAVQVGMGARTRVFFGPCLAGGIWGLFAAGWRPRALHIMAHAKVARDLLLLLLSKMQGMVSRFEEVRSGRAGRCRARGAAQGRGADRKGSPDATRERWAPVSACEKEFRHVLITMC